MLRHFTILFYLLINTVIISFAQHPRQTTVADTLTPIEIDEVNAAARHSTFGYYSLADSFSRVGDSINAGKYFRKIDPYYLAFEQQTPYTIDTFIIDHFMIPQKIRKKYVSLFNKVYNAPRSAAYINFQTMAKEDQALRKKTDTTANNASFIAANEKMHYTDSIHFLYLYNYIKKNGWPSFSDGAMYASVLAIHDHEHADEYIPIIKRAVLDGKADMGVLQWITYWHAHARMNNEVLQKHLAAHKYVRFDISSVISDDTLPPSLPAIEMAIKQHCPARLFFICESKDNKLYKVWSDKMLAMYQQGPLSMLTMELVRYNCGITYDERSSLEYGLWSTHWEALEHEDLRLILYVTYDRENDSIKFEKTSDGEKFITHAINFEVNRSTIKLESIDFISQLADWLKQNPLVNLEIDGHTDSDGEAATNRKLSQARAEEVKKRLVKLGIDNVRLTTKGYGDTKPIDTNTTPTGKANNRRVEFIKL